MASNAWAACPYDAGALLEDLAAVETAVRGEDRSMAVHEAMDIQAGLACLDEPLPYAFAARVYRGVGAGLVAGGEPGEGWFRTAIQLDPGFEYGVEDMGADSPIRGAFEGQRALAETAPVSLTDRQFVPGPSYYLDGSLVGAPRATLDRPHVFQVRDGDEVTTWVIEGNAFPESALIGTEPIAMAEPADKKKRTGRYATKGGENVTDDGTYIPPRPKEKTPLIIAGSATIAAAGGLYAWSSASRNAFENADTVDQMEKLKATTNGLVIASFAMLGTGAGVLAWGIIVDDTGRPLPGVRIGF